MGDGYSQKAQAIFGRELTVEIGVVIGRLPKGFTRKQLLNELGLGDGQRVLGLVNRELEALCKGRLLKHVSRGRYERSKDAYWDFIVDLESAWRTQADRVDSTSKVSDTEQLRPAALAIAGRRARK